MTSFLALYRGSSVASAEVVGMSADPELVAEFATRMLQRRPTPEGDPVLAARRRSERHVLRLVRDEAVAAPAGEQ